MSKFPHVAHGRGELPEKPQSYIFAPGLLPSALPLSQRSSSALLLTAQVSAVFVTHHGIAQVPFMAQQQNQGNTVIKKSPQALGAADLL